MALTPREIEDRFEEAAFTLRRLPEKDRPRGFAAAEAPMRVIPSAAAITRMEECFDWLLMLDPEDARIVWLRAEGVRWRQVCIRAGVVSSTAWRRWAASLLTIANRLIAQDKLARKSRPAKSPSAKAVARADESGPGTLL